MRKSLYAMLSTAEDQYLTKLSLVEEVVEDIELVSIFWNPYYILVDVSSGVSSLHGNTHRLAKEFMNKFFYFCRKGGREEERVFLFRHFLHHKSHVADEAH